MNYYDMNKVKAHTDGRNLFKTAELWILQKLQEFGISHLVATYRIYLREEDFMMAWDI